jgi:hypothetical protein
MIFPPAAVPPKRYPQRPPTHGDMMLFVAAPFRLPADLYI